MLALSLLSSLLILTPVLGADVWFSQSSFTCLLSETAVIGDFVFKVKALTANPSQKLIYSITSESPFVFLPRSNEGRIKLSQNADKIAPLVSGTRRASITLRVAFQDNSRIFVEVKINLIVLKLGYGDKYVDSVISNFRNLVKDDNIFRKVTTKYPVFKRLHRILMRGSPESRAVSKAGVGFLRVVREIIKRIIQEFSVPKGRIRHHLGFEGILSPEKLEVITALTNCVKAVKRPISCPPNNKFRTIDGTCNNLRNPTFGAADTGFVRLLDAEYFDADGLNDPLGAGDQPGAPERPNAFNVTEDFITEQKKSAGNSEQTANIYMQWGQFIDHDMTLAPESEGGDKCEEIPCTGVDEDFDDPCFPILPTPRRDQCIRFIRSAAVCQSKPYDLKPREQINVNTAYLDASMVYGSSERVQTALRDLTNDKGLLRVSNRNLLPLDESELIAPNDLCLNFGGCFLAGDTRVNEQASLAAIHTLFVREHNRIAIELKKLNPHWDGERIYQEARKIVGALVQKITYKDWLPIALGGRGVASKYVKYNEKVNAGISNAFATAAYRFGHSTVRPTFDFLNPNFDPIHKPIPLVQMFFNNTLIQREGVEGFLLGTVGNVSQTVDTEVAKGLTRQLFQRQPNAGLDLAALNVQRGRDHGLPSYEAFRRLCGFKPVESFDELRDVITDDNVRNALKRLYKTPDNTDLWPAGLAEDSSRARGGSLGPTFACLVDDQFRRLRDGDRFYYENPGVFTRPQLRAIRRSSMSRILCDNVAGIVSIQRNAFRVPRRSSRRRSCSRIPQLNLEPWKEYRSPCAEIPCKNGGTCVAAGQTFTCQCPMNWMGQLCEIKVDACFSNPCQNGGRCRKLRNGRGFRCRCGNTGFTGRLCDVKAKR